MLILYLKKGGVVFNVPDSLVFILCVLVSLNSQLGTAWSHLVKEACQLRNCLVILACLLVCGGIVLM